MNDKRPPEDWRVLGSYELQLRNLAGVQRHAQPIVERLQGRRGFAEAAGEVLSHLHAADLEAWAASVHALRTSLEREGA